MKRNFWHPYKYFDTNELMINDPIEEQVPNSQLLL